MQKQLVMPFEEYNALKSDFVNPDLITEMRDKYGDDQVAAAIRNGSQEFLKTPEAQNRDFEGWRHAQGWVVHFLPIDSQGLDGYVKKLRDCLADEGERLRSGETIRYIHHLAEPRGGKTTESRG